MASINLYRISDADLTDVAEAIDFCNFYANEMRALGTPQHTQIVAGETNLQYWWPRGAGMTLGRG